MHCLHLLQIFSAEFMGTAFLLYFGCTGMQYVPENEAIATLLAPLVWGFTITAIITAYCHVSEAHLNPCITLCAVLKQRISVTAALVYILAQFSGATSGFWTMTMLSSNELLSQNSTTNGFCVTTIHPSYTLWQGFLAEFIGTSFLIFVVCGAWDPRCANHTDSLPVKLGMAVAAIIFGLAHISGASLNPARSFGPAVISWIWKHHWVYWTSPLIATVISTTLHKLCFKEISKTN